MSLFKKYLFLIFILISFLTVFQFLFLKNNLIQNNINNKNNEKNLKRIDNDLKIVKIKSLDTTLYEIFPNPDHDGIIYLDWNKSTGAINYYIYRNTSNIISLDGLTPIANVSTTYYKDIIKNVGKFYYVIVASNGTTNGSLSNCVNVSVDFNGRVWTKSESITREMGFTSEIPSIAIDKKGNVHLTWRSYGTYGGSGPDIDNYYRRWNASTSSWTEIEVVSTVSTNLSLWPKIAVDDNCNAHIVWSDETNYTSAGNDRDIFYRCWNASTGNWSITEVISTEELAEGGSNRPAIATDSNGNIHVVWVDNSGYKGSNFDYDIFYKFWNATSNNWTITEVVSNESNSESWHPSIAVGEFGNAHVVWHDEMDYGGSGPDYDIHYRFRNFTNGEWNITEIVSKNISTGSYTPAIALDKDSNIHVVWDHPVEIAYSQKNATTGDWTEAVNITTETSGSAIRPTMAVDEDGNVHVAWEDYTQFGDSGSEINIFYKFWNVINSNWTSTEIISTESFGPSNGYPEIDIDNSGNVHIAWDGPISPQLLYKRTSYLIIESPNNLTYNSSEIPITVKNYTNIDKCWFRSKFESPLEWSINESLYFNNTHFVNNSFIKWHHGPTAIQIFANDSSSNMFEIAFSFNVTPNLINTGDFDSSWNLDVNKTWGTENDEIVYDAEHFGEFIYFCGKENSSGKYDAFLTKCNLSGSEIWNVSYGVSNLNEQGRGIAISNDGKYIFMSGYDNIDATIRAFLVKFNSSGEQIWNYTWDKPGLDESFSVALSPDNENVYISGMCSFLGTYSGFIANFNASTGENIWNITWDTENSDAFISIKVSNDGYIYVFGSINNEGWNGLLAKFNASSGEQIWNNTWETRFHETNSPDFIITEDNEIYNIGGWTDAWLMEYNISTGKEIWNKSWGNKGVDYPLGLSMMGNQIFIVGKTTSFSNGDYDGFILSIDENKTLKETKFWLGTQDDYFSRIIPINNSLIVIGYTSSLGAGNYDVIFLKFYDPPPQYFNETINLPSPQNYAPNQHYQYNITIIDNIEVDTVLFEWDGDNYTVATYVDNEYYYDIYDLGVGTYQYRWWFNDTSNNWNFTAQKNYEIQKATPSIELYLNGTLNDRTYGLYDKVNITIVLSASLNVEFYINESLEDSGLSPFTNITGFAEKASYNITGYFPGNINYTDVRITRWVFIDSEEPNCSNENVNLPSPQDYVPNQHYQFNLTMMDNIEVDTVLFEWDGINDTVNTHFNDEYYYDIFDLAVGTYQYRWYFNDTSNNWNSTISKIYTINPSTPTINISLNGTLGNYQINRTQFCYIQINLTNNDIIYFYLNDSLMGSGSSPYINISQYNQTGIYNITGYYPGNQNYTEAVFTRWLTVIDVEEPQY